MTSWSMEDKWGDDICIQYGSDPDLLDICITQNGHNEQSAATVLLFIHEAIALRDALTRFIEAME